MLDKIEYQNKIKSYSNEKLLWIINDANETIMLNPEGKKTHHYLDEIIYCATELKNRRNKSSQF